MALFYPDILQSNNPNAYGIIKSVEAVGHKRVQALSDLYTLPDPILSESGNNTGNDAIGQLWYVTEQNKHYQLINWDNRKQSSGWAEYSSGSSDYNDLENKPDLSKYLDKTTTSGQNVSSAVYFVSEGRFVGIEPTSGSVFSANSDRTLQTTINYQNIQTKNGSQESVLYPTGLKISGKTDQDLVTANNSTTKLKTINNQSILGEGNITIETPEGGITDAPKDGNTYGRKDGAWAQIPNYVTPDQLPDSTSDLTNDSGYITETDIPVTNVNIVGSGSSIINASFTDKTLTLTKGEAGISEIPVATTSTLGGVKLGYTETDNNYPLQLDSNNQAYVTVPIDLVYEEVEGIVEGLNLATFTVLSQEEYNQLNPKDENTIYFIR